MRGILGLAALCLLLSACDHDDRPVVVPQTSQAPPAATTIIVPQGATVVCPGGNPAVLAGGAYRC